MTINIIKRLNQTISTLTLLVGCFHLYKSGFFFILLKEVKNMPALEIVVIGYFILSCLIVIFAVISFCKNEWWLIFLGILLFILSLGDFIFVVSELNYPSGKEASFVWQFKVSWIERIFYWILGFGIIRRGIIQIKRRRASRHLIRHIEFKN
jgi:hypothetical protein